MRKPNKQYLGDSVYAQWDKYLDGAIILTTENGLESDPSNEIFLEPEVLHALDLYLKGRF